MYRIFGCSSAKVSVLHDAWPEFGLGAACVGSSQARCSRRLLRHDGIRVQLSRFCATLHSAAVGDVLCALPNDQHRCETLPLFFFFFFLSKPNLEQDMLGVVAKAQSSHNNDSAIASSWLKRMLKLT